MVEQILVSISCLTFNHEFYIRDAIDGFLSQKTSFNFEVLIHDDASTDNTADIIREYESKYPHIIKPIYQKENQYSKRDGTIGRLQRSRAKGKYYAICEGDDYWIDPFKLQKQVDFLENNSEYSFVHCHNQILYQNSGRIIINKNINKKLNDNNAYNEIITRKRKISTLTVLLRAELVRTIYSENSEIFSGKYLLGDLPLWLELSRLGKVKYLSDVVAVYRIHSDSVSNSSEGIKVLNFEKNVQLLINDYLKKYEVSCAMKNKAIAYHSLNTLLAAKKFGHIETVYEQNKILRNDKLYKFLDIRYKLKYLGTINSFYNLFSRLILKIIF